MTRAVQTMVVFGLITLGNGILRAANGMAWPAGLFASIACALITAAGLELYVHIRNTEGTRR